MKRIRRSERAFTTASRGGFGKHHTSPIKAGDARKKGLVRGFGRAQQSDILAAELDALLRGETVAGAQAGPATGEDVQMEDWVDTDPPAAPIFVPPPPPPPPRPPLPFHSRRSAADAANERLNAAWNALLPLLEVPWSQFYERTHGRQRDCIPAVLAHVCTTSCNGPIAVYKVKCLYTSYIQNVEITTCPCKSAAVLLVEHGVFPASPTQPKTGISIDLLDFYRALFERSCDAVTALAAALHTLYERRGFRVCTVCYSLSQGEEAVDPFRRVVTQAVQWSCNLRVRLEQRVELALAQAQLSLQSVVQGAPTTGASATFVASGAASGVSAISATSTIADSEPSIPPDTSPSNVPAASATPSPLPDERDRADRTLCERCPACFNLSSWGRPLKDGGDVQNGGDACFSYRHNKKAGDGSISYRAKYFLTKEFVDGVRKRVLAARKKPNANPKRRVAKEVIDACEQSWDAANEKKKKTNSDRYDASGVFVMTCRHGQVIFMANVDTPGEQQCYIIAMLERLFSLLPWNATVMQAYDVACVTDHSLDLYPIFSPSIRDRLAFVINGMHAYGHQWACQLVYSPRFRLGMGLADHECVERFWSRIRKLIPLTRGQWSSRRIWMLDMYADFVAKEGRTNLGNWIHRQQEKNLTSKYRAAMKTIDECRITDQELRAQWAAQKAAQTSIHAPNRLRRELDKVLSLQTQIDAVERAIEDTKKTFNGSGASERSLKILRGLEATHEQLSGEAEALYSSLNIQESFPELRSLPLEFAQTLLVLRDLKINIRKRATGSFMEWETLDRAVSGRREALGTKLHQSTRKAITRRQPALLKAITKFNTGCATLERLCPPQSPIPLPSPLSTQLNVLRNDPTLHEDVWITPSEGPIPRWLNDQDVRDGIRSLHVLDRCAEEIVRLNTERDNLRRWLSHEKDVVNRSLETIHTSDSWLKFLLLQRSAEVDDLERLWSPFLQHKDIENRIISRPSVASATSATSANRRVTSVTPSATPFATPFAAPPPAGIPHPRTSSVSEDGGIFSTHLPVVSVSLPVTRGLPQVSVIIDSGDISDEEEIQIIEEVFDNSDDEEEVETSAAEATSGVLEIQWEFKAPNDIDTTFIQDLVVRNHDLISTAGNFTHYVVRNNRRPLSIAVHDLRPFTVPTGLVNGYGLNGVATSLLNVFSAPYSPFKAAADQCAVFSTYDLPKVHYKGSDPDLWRHISPTEYWNKSKWLIPIHRAREVHWVFVVVLVEARQLLFFDSLGSSGGWRQDLRDVMVLITRLVALANRNSHPLHVSTEDPEEKWVARPLFKVGEPRQHNDYDCGLWVLSMMAAFMRGHEDIAQVHADMPWVRNVFRKHIETLPIS
ncbi:hypothetical protein R3P38DRAFT_2510672 [Favolaschia claudopus]|uniref:Ubiquitin-like protease family profile domain-containing protein n=1 Tax=Favolaschia claudopus TaxID=2862362 RepID=A0AAW0CWY3_9AGAR